MKKALEGKVAIITGSGGGIGKATALLLGQAGASVMLNGRNESKLKQAARELEVAGIKVDFCVADVQSHEGAQMLVDCTVQTFGKLDILVNNASSSMRAEFSEMDPVYFRAVLDSNIYGTVYPTRAAFPYIAQTKGSIVFISSLAGLYGLPSASAYSAGKMALTALIQSLRAELKHTGVHLGIVYVGFTKNDDTKRVLNAKGEPVPVAHRPGGLQQTQEQVAQNIFQLIIKRKHKTILSFMGKVMHILVKIAPTLVDIVLERSTNKMSKMLE